MDAPNAVTLQVNKVAKNACVAGWNWEMKSVIWVMVKLKSGKNARMQNWEGLAAWKMICIMLHLDSSIIPHDEPRHLGLASFSSTFRAKFLTMKSKLLFSILLLLGGFFLFQACKSSKNASASDSSYTCPMHPEIKGKKGDSCSKCQMQLTESKAPAVFCCPVHKECTSKMSGKCPKCGIPMEQPVQPYICPMHPDQKGKKGERCPKCRMELEMPKPGKGVGR